MTIFSNMMEAKAKKLSDCQGFSSNSPSFRLGECVGGTESSIFSEVLAALDIQLGDAVLVHSSGERLGVLDQPPLQIIEQLKARIGRGGLLCFPTFPWNQSRLPFNPNITFSVARTPSRAGMLSEIFRRTEKVYRSAHPWNPFAAWGDGAEALVAEQEAVTELFNSRSVLQKLSQMNAKVMGMGVGLGMTAFVHYPEWLYQPKLPWKPFDVVTVDRIETLHGVVEKASFEIVPLRMQNIIHPGPLFEKYPSLKSYAKFLNIQGTYFFSYFSKDLIEVALGELEQALRNRTYPCWYKSDPTQASSGPDGSNGVVSTSQNKDC